VRALQRIDLVVQLHPYAKATAAQPSAGVNNTTAAATAAATAGVGTAEVDADDGDVEQLQARALHEQQLRSSDDTTIHESTIDAATAHTSPPVRHVPDEQQQQQQQQQRDSTADNTADSSAAAAASDSGSARTVLQRADSDQLDAATLRPNLLTTWKSNANSGTSTNAATAATAAATAAAAATSSADAAVDTSCDGRAAVFCQLPCADWVGTVFANSSHPLAEGVSHLRTVRTGVADASTDGSYYAGLVQYEYQLGSRPVRHLWYNGWQVRH
jgi:hypothetical protein